jgi:sugar phosphate isomerase/epimerase
MSNVSRRAILGSMAAAGVAAVFASPKPAEAIGPIARTGKPKFKFSLAAYSYRDLLAPKKEAPAELTLADFVNDCAKFQLDGTELTSYYFPKPVTGEFLRQLARQCFRLGLDVSGTAIGNDFGFPEGEERRKQIESTKQWIDHAVQLRAPVIRIFAGHQKKEVTEAQSHSLMVSAMEECCEYAGQRGIHLALENHGGPTATAEGLLRFVRDVQSPWFGVNLDTGNFHSDDIYGEIERVAPYALNVQVKVVVSGPDGKKREADFKRLAKILSETGYRGYIVLEFEEAGDPREECEKNLERLREAFA